MRASIQSIGFALLMALGGPGANGADSPAAVERAATKTESFDRDPGWDASNNRMLPKQPRRVAQDFGYNSQTHDIGGRVTRAMKPAFYALTLDKPKTLDEKFSASGTFYLNQTGTGGAAAFFGWFNADQREGTGRPSGSLGMEIGGERNGGRLAVRLLTASNRGAGHFVTKFEHYNHDKANKAAMRPTPIRNDGTRYTWTFTYDPDAAGGNGQIQFIVKSNLPEPQDFEGKLVTVDLPPGYKQEHTTFDHFGLMNNLKPGGTMNVHFDDLTIDGKRQDFRAEPAGWAFGNRVTYDEPAAVGAHNFGFSAETEHAGGAHVGEIGGDMWRGGGYAFYADHVGPLTLDDRLEARGKVVLESGAPDSDVFLGWFAGDSKTDSPVAAGSFLGVHVGGPTRVGHYFQPAVTTASGTRMMAKDGPVMRQGKACDWTLAYDPAAASGNGAITVTLGDETVTLPLKPGLRKQGGNFDHFGLLNYPIGGQLVRIYLDDVTYTAGK